MLTDVIKSMNFSYEVMENVWITAGLGIISDAKSIFGFLSRYIGAGDTVMVSQITTPASMDTIHSNTCQSGIREIIYS